jgi:hypothetical protein
MLFGETVAVYCEKHTEHTDTVRTSQQTHYVSLQRQTGSCSLRKQSLWEPYTSVSYVSLAAAVSTDGLSIASPVNITDNEGLDVLNPAETCDGAHRTQELRRWVYV